MTTLDTAIDSPSYWATSEGFAEYLTDNPTNEIDTISSEGYYYADDAPYSATVDSFNFYSLGGLNVRYTATSLNITEIAPVPLPASLPLLGFGMAAVGFIARRRKA